MSNARFTIDGSDALEAHLETICSKVAAGILHIVPRSIIQAVFLGGGYGRGEGGVLKTPEGDKPYNDLEFYICLKGSTLLNERKFSRQFHRFAEELTSDAEIEVEFKITSLEKIHSGPLTMFLYDLAMGHRTLIGDDSLFLDPRFSIGSAIPLYEATRLLMNRCSGLLFAQEQLLSKPFTSENADFVGRNHAKAQLGFGDIVLTALGQYHWSCRERNLRLKTAAEEVPLPWIKKVFCHHVQGLEFKLHPEKKLGTPESFQLLQTELISLGQELWLWLEGRRLHERFASIRDYVLSQHNKCPETNSLRNVLVNLKTYGAKSFLNKKVSRYPRERLLHALGVLLWEGSALDDPALLQQVQQELRTSATDFSGLVSAYRLLWQRFN